MLTTCWSYGNETNRSLTYRYLLLFLFELQAEKNSGLNLHFVNFLYVGSQTEIIESHKMCISNISLPFRYHPKNPQMKKFLYWSFK